MISLTFLITCLFIALSESNLYSMNGSGNNSGYQSLSQIPHSPSQNLLSSDEPDATRLRQTRMVSQIGPVLVFCESLQDYRAQLTTAWESENIGQIYNLLHGSRYVYELSSEDIVCYVQRASVLLARESQAEGCESCTTQRALWWTLCGCGNLLLLIACWAGLCMPDSLAPLEYIVTGTSATLGGVALQATQITCCDNNQRILQLRLLLSRLEHLETLKRLSLLHASN